MSRTTWRGRTYVSSVLVSQANALLVSGTCLILPVGVIFEPTTTSDLYTVVGSLPFAGRFLAQRADGTGEPLHAVARAVKRVTSVPEVCPPVTEWERSSS